MNNPLVTPVIPKEKIKSMADSIGQSCERVQESFEMLSNVFELVCSPMVDFGSTVYDVAELQYLINHKVLPGSLKTKRLRKKRIALVLKEF